MLAGLSGRSDSAARCFALLRDFACAGSARQRSAASRCATLRRFRSAARAHVAGKPVPVVGGLPTGAGRGAPADADAVRPVYRTRRAEGSAGLAASDDQDRRPGSLPRVALVSSRNVLALVQSQAAAVAMCESGRWNCVASCLGLVACRVPLQLKADLLLFLASLATHAELCPAVLASLAGIVEVPDAGVTTIGLKVGNDVV